MTRTKLAPIGALLVLLLFATAWRGHDASAQVDAHGSLTPARIRAALARYRHEPSVDAVVQAALDAPQLDPDRARDAADRARLAGLLPQARADVRRGQVLDLGTAQTGTTDRTTWSTGDELAFGGSLTFQLDRLIFAGEEASLLRERRALEERRLAVETQVVHLYFERRRLQLERDLGGRVEVATEVRIIEAGALLDVFTNGAFSRMMASASREPDRPEDSLEGRSEEVE